MNLMKINKNIIIDSNLYKKIINKEIKLDEKYKKIH